MWEGYLIAQDHQSLETLYKIFLAIDSLEQRLVISLTQSIGHDVHSGKSICVIKTGLSDVVFGDS